MAPSCNDSIACTTDSCSDTLGACQHLPVNSASNDGQFCNGQGLCDVTLGCKQGARSFTSPGRFSALRRVLMFVGLVVLVAVVSAVPPEKAEAPLTRERIREMYEKRDPYCGTRDPWANFRWRRKEPAELELLIGWANETSELIALMALQGEENAKLLPFWRANISKFPRASAARQVSVLGLLKAGGPAVIDEAYAHLGESAALDQGLLSEATNDGFSRAIPLLRAYQRSAKVLPEVKQELTERLLSLDSEHAGNDEDAFLASGDERSLAIALESDEMSVARLEKLFPLLAKTTSVSRYGNLRGELGDKIAFGLFHLLEQPDAKALKLAERWSTATDKKTIKLLSIAPSVSLVLALWAQSRGELSRARHLFERGLSDLPPSPITEQNYKMDDPEVGYAALMLQYACLLEATGERQRAVTQLETFEAWSRPLKHELHDLLDNLAFRSYSPYWCYRSASAKTLTAMPLVLTATRRRSASGFEITAEVRNASASQVTVKTCAAGTGELPGDTLWVSLGATGSLKAPTLSCRPKTRTLAPGEKLTATFDAERREKQAPAGPLRMSLRAALVPSQKDQQELEFLFEP